MVRISLHATERAAVVLSMEDYHSLTAQAEPESLFAGVPEGDNFVIERDRTWAEIDL